MTVTDESCGVVIFRPWADPEVDDRAIAVGGTYSRTAWLPVLGATTWLVWDALALHLAGSEEVRCSLDDLAPPWAGADTVVAWSLERLEAYGLAAGSGETWVVRRTCPPLGDRWLARAPSTVHAVHASTF